MTAPDHWAAISLLGKVSNWTEQRLIGVTVVAGFGHILLSVILALAGFTLIFSAYISALTAQLIGALMLATGLYVIFNALYSTHHKKVRMPKVAKKALSGIQGTML